MDRNRLFRWLLAPALRGPWAIAALIVAVVLPTIARLAVHGTVTGCEFTPYLPFVLLSAIIIGLPHAGIVALSAVAILGGLFVAPMNGHIDMPCFISGTGVFLASSAISIGLVALMRRMLKTALGRDLDDSASGIVFIEDRGEVWASWRGSGPPVRIGSKASVLATMKDFLSTAEPKD